MLNTTFEKEDDEEVEEALLIPPPPPAFQNEPEEEEVVDAPANASNTFLNVPEEIEEKFHTPVEDNKRDSVLDLTDLQEGRVDKLLETISALFDEVRALAIILDKEKFAFIMHSIFLARLPSNQDRKLDLSVGSSFPVCQISCALLGYQGPSSRKTRKHNGSSRHL